MTVATFVDTSKQITALGISNDGYIWYAYFNGGDAKAYIMQSDSAWGTTFTQRHVTDAWDYVIGFAFDSNNRLLVAIDDDSAGDQKVFRWNGSAMVAFDAATTAIISICSGRDGYIYLNAGVATRKIRRCGPSDSAFSDYNTYNSSLVFNRIGADASGNVYGPYSFGQKIYKSAGSGAYSDLGLTAKPYHGVVPTGLDKYVFLSGDDYLWKAKNSDSFSEYLDTDATQLLAGDPYGNLMYASTTVNGRIHILKYGITYDGNGDYRGTAPTDALLYRANESAIAEANSGSLVKYEYIFTGWNTADDGSGTHYNVGDPITMTADDLTLYAEWQFVGHLGKLSGRSFGAIASITGVNANSVVKFTGVWTGIKLP